MLFCKEHSGMSYHLWNFLVTFSTDGRKESRVVICLVNRNYTAKIKSHTRLIKSKEMYIPDNLFINLRMILTILSHCVVTSWVFLIAHSSEYLTTQKKK